MGLLRYSNVEQALFRDVAMMVPDYGLISAITLYSFGYLQVYWLARPIIRSQTKKSVFVVYPTAIFVDVRVISV